MHHRHRVGGLVAIVALTSLAVASACGVDGSIQGASSGTSGTSGTSGSAGTSGTSGSAGTSGTSADAATPKTEVKELQESTGLRSLAVGANKLVFVEATTLEWCEAPECPAKTTVSNPPGPAPTAVTFGGGKFYGAFNTQLRACEPKTNEVDCNGGDTATDPSLTNAARLRYDGSTFVWIQTGNVFWRGPSGGAVQNVSLDGQHEGLWLWANRVFFSQVGTAGKAWVVDDAAAAAAKREAANNLLEPNDIVADGASFFVVARGNASAANGYVQRCDIDGTNCSKPVEKLESPGGVALDATYLYVSETGRNQVLRVPRTGGPPVRIAALVQPTEIVLDDRYAYVIANDDASNKRAYRVTKVP